MTKGPVRRAVLPFCKGTVVLPRDRRGAIAGMALAAPSRRAVVRAHRAVAVTVGALGAWWLPRSPVMWPEWLDGERAGALLEDIERSLGRIDDVALHIPRRKGRCSLAMVVIRSGEPVAFVKAKPDLALLDLEASAMAALAGGGPGALHVARPIARGSCGAHWLATTVLDGPHLPDYDEPDPAYEEWLDECLRPVISMQAPAHWRAAHGDLAPWNLRRLAGTAWLIDWESATLAPPGADRTYFRAARAVLLRRDPGPAPDEAVEYWLQEVSARDDWTDPLNARLLEILPRMRTAGTRTP